MKKQETRFGRFGKHGLLALALAIGSLNVHAALQGRDINGNPVAANEPSAVFVYDTDLDITWLRDWNYAQTSGHDADGRMNWADAVAWASGLALGSFSDWRLPTADPGCGLARNCIGSEMGHVWYTELGNTEDSLTNMIPFENLQSPPLYWSNTELAPDTTRAWGFETVGGRQAIFDKDFKLYAVAVRPGDVAPVPEPGSLAMLLAGLGVALSAARRRPH